jgi:hypothetical protein
MSEPLVDRIPFAKIITVLAIIFGVSLGLCGMTAFISSREGASGNYFVVFGIIELIAMAGSAAGLILTTIVWVVLSMIRPGGRND